MKNVACALMLVAVLAWQSGCAKPADVSKPKHFSADAISFDYPGNWKVSKNEKLPVGRLVFLEEPGNAIVTITAFDKGYNLDLEDYGREFTKNLGAGVPFNLLRITNTSAQAGRIDCKFTIQLAGMSVPHTANLTKHSFREYEAICVTQVADEDRPLVAKGFDLILSTLSAKPPPKQPLTASPP